MRSNEGALTTRWFQTLLAKILKKQAMKSALTILIGHSDLNSNYNKEIPVSMIAYVFFVGWESSGYKFN